MFTEHRWDLSRALGAVAGIAKQSGAYPPKAARLAQTLGFACVSAPNMDPFRHQKVTQSRVGIRNND